MDVSVVVCTRNRAAQLAQLLTSMTRLVIPAGLQWELVIIDNGSTDNTAGTVHSFRQSLPVRHVFEAKAGLSNARNCGVDNAAGNYFLWTDDDVLVDPNWLAGYMEAFRRWPDAKVFGGKITPVLESPTPKWFQDAVTDLRFLLAARDFGPSALPLSVPEGRVPFGASYAIEAAEQKRHRYDPNLGVAPGRRRGGEEEAVIKAILSQGHSGWWVPDAEVRHIIPTARQTIHYVMHYYEGTGEAAAHSQAVGYSSAALKMPLEIAIKLPLAFIRLYLAYNLGSKKWVSYLASYSYQHGKFRQWLASVHDEGLTSRQV